MAAYEIDHSEYGWVVLATEEAAEREAGEVVAGAYGHRGRAERVCRHLNAGWSPAEANRYEWPEGRMAQPRSLRTDVGRFLVLGGPGGYLATARPDTDLADSRWRGWVVLFGVNRPLTPALRSAALGAALRHFEIV